MKIALLQPDIIDRDFDHNIHKIASMCAESELADLCVAPAEAITGPGQSCLFQAPDWQRQALNLAQTLADSLKSGQALLTSLPGLGSLLIANGKFEAGAEIFEFNGLRLGVNCAADSAADIIAHLTSRPFEPAMQTEWELMLSGHCRQQKQAALAVNLCGGYGNVIYNGQSVAVDKTGRIAGRALAFAEDALLLEIDPEPVGRIEPLLSDLGNQWAALRLGVADFFAKTGASQAVLGLSGGMDSALVACIAADALGAENVTGILLPSQYTSQESIRDAEDLAANLDIKTFTIPIGPVFSKCRQLLQPVFAQTKAARGELTEENLQARIRGILLMAYANRTGALLLNTGNKSESAMGYCTLYGDTAGALAVIGDLFKTRVYELARWYCDGRGAMIIPENIFEKAPTAELRPGQKDTDSLPPYSILDQELKRLLHGEKGLEELAQKVRRNQFKRRQSPPPLLVDGLPLSSFC